MPIFAHKSQQRQLAVQIPYDIKPLNLMALHCWIGNQDGSIFVLDHDGNVLNQYRLPDGVKCIVADGAWVYAGCDNGCVYDLTGKLPRLAY